MSRALYMNKEDARDIRNLDQLLSDPVLRARLITDRDMANDLWSLFRRWRVRLDKAGDTTRPWQHVNRNDGRRTRHNKRRQA